jgi:hypothetical protein
MLDQPGDDAYVANNVTKALAGPDGMAVEYLQGNTTFLRTQLIE